MNSMSSDSDIDYYTAVIISTVNYYARNDPLVFFDRRAASLMKQTENCTYQEVTYAKHNTTFVFLEGKARSPIFDHSLEGPTYQVSVLATTVSELNLILTLYVYRRSNPTLLAGALCNTSTGWLFTIICCV
jgi:hypothetical protein